MEFSNFYTVETLQCLNDLHDYGYPITQIDVDKVNRLISLMHQKRDNNETPAAGDIIAYTTRSGDYYRNAHIERMDDKEAYICLTANIPFCFDNKGKAGYDTEGGLWTQLEQKLPEPDGMQFKLFKTWGSRGRCKDGAVYFMATVRVWKYAEPEPLYEQYSTKDWAKYNISRLPDPEQKGEYFYTGDGFTLYSRRELDRLIEMLHGELFCGIYRNSLILWGYRMEWKLLTGQEWNRTDAETHLSFLGEQSVKIRTCHDTHTVFIYKRK